MGHCNTCSNGFADFGGQCDSCRRRSERLRPQVDPRTPEERLAACRHHLAYLVELSEKGPHWDLAIKNTRAEIDELAAALDERGAHEREMENR